MEPRIEIQTSFNERLEVMVRFTPNRNVWFYDNGIVTWVAAFPELKPLLKTLYVINGHDKEEQKLPYDSQPRIEVGNFSDGRLKVIMCFDTNSNLSNSRFWINDKGELIWFATPDKVELLLETINAIDKYNEEKRSLPPNYQFTVKSVKL